MNKSESASEPFLESLIVDVSSAIRRREAEDTQSHRRDLVRTLFSAMDGLVWVYRTEISEIARNCDMLTPEEALALSERFVSVSSQGKITTQDRFVSMSAMIRLTARLATRINRSFQPDFGSEDWARFGRALKIRNRVTHPKASSDLLISAENLTECITGFYWLFDHCVKGMELAMVEFKIYLVEFRTLLEQLESGDPDTLTMYNRVMETHDNS